MATPRTRNKHISGHSNNYLTSTRVFMATGDLVDCVTLASF